MKNLMSKCSLLCVFIFGLSLSIFADNQTSTVSSISSAANLPYQVRIEVADFALPSGLQSYVLGTYDNKWLILAGRTNGLHGFDNGDNNFPPNLQNTTVYVVDPTHKKITSRSLLSHKSGLSQHQVDLLSVTSAQFYQSGNTLYMTGGYGVDTKTGSFSTKDALTAISIPGLIHWVTHPSHGETAAQYIRQIFDPIFKVTGGYMTQIGDNPILQIFGQNFKGAYTQNSNGKYIEQIRRFNIIDNGISLFIDKKSSEPYTPNSNYRRRDLNIVPRIKNQCGRITEELVAFSGVFTLSGGVWTVPVEIGADGRAFMPSASSDKTFKQGMNNYICPTLGLFSRKSNDMYTIFFGGISFGYFENGIFQTDINIPFINQVTTIKIDKKGHYKQYIMDVEYPVILSTQSNPGNRLLFGAAAQLIPVDNLPAYSNGVLQLDKIKKTTFIGYIVGGIQSTLPNTSSRFDSAASPYIFKVTLIPSDDSEE